LSLDRVEMSTRSKLRLPAIFLFCLILAVIMTWPLAVTFDRYPLFDHLDTAATFYNFWWQYYSLFQLHTSPWFNPMINYPDGYSMVFFPVYLSYGIFSWPLQAIFGTPASLPGFFHWISILSFALTSFMGFLLFREITGSRSAGFAAAILFSFIPFHYWHLPRCHTSCLELMLLPVYFYLGLLKKKDWKSGVYFGLSLVPVLYQSPNYVIYLTIFFALNLLYMLFTDRQSLDQKWLKAVATASALALALSSPYLFAGGRELLRKSTPATSTVQEQSLYSANLIGFVTPAANQRLYGELGEAAEKIIGSHGVSGKELFPGLVLLLTAALGLLLARKKIRQSGFWILIFLVFLILSLGPYLNIAGHTFYTIPLPYYFLRRIFFFFEMDRSPVRAVIFSLLSIAVFASGFFKRLEQKFPGRKSRMVLAAVAVLGIAELNQAPIKIDRVPIPAPYREIAKESGQFTILELPLLPDIYRYSGFYQPYHQKRLAIDLTARKVGAGFSDDALFFYLDEPLRFFRLGRENQEKALEQMRAEFKRRDIKYAIVYLKFIDAQNKEDLERLFRLIGRVEIFYSDRIFKVYEFGYKGG